jgi:hypothetical protein
MRGWVRVFSLLRWQPGARARSMKATPPQSKTRRWLWRIFNCLGFFLLVWAASIGWEFLRAINDEGYLNRKYGSELGTITSVEVVSLGEYPTPGLERHFPHLSTYRRHLWSEEGRYIHSKARLRGKDAQEIARLWRSQGFHNRFSAGCHEPAYVLRFYFGPWKRAEMTVCWKCLNAEVPAGPMAVAITFDALGTNGLALFDALKRWAPLPTEQTYAYTNEAIPADEIRRRVSEAMWPVVTGGDEEFLEYALHSASRGSIEDEIAGKLGSKVPKERADAARFLRRMSASRFAPQLVQMLSDPNERARNNAGWALCLIGGPIDFAPVHSAMLSQDTKTRSLAVAIMARHGDSAPQPLHEFRSQVEKAIERFGSKTFKDPGGLRVELTEERRAAIQPAIDRISSVCGTNSIACFRRRVPPVRPEFAW